VSAPRVPEPALLIHVGYPQAASTWLQQFLFRDREAGFRWLGKKREGHPVRQLVGAHPLDFDVHESRAQFEPLLEKARTAALLPVVSYERFAGHPFGGGHDSKEIADRLAAVFPEGRVLIVIREQRSVIASMYKNYVRAGGSASLRQLLEPVVSKQARVPSFDFRYYEYDRLIRRYHALFGRDAVLVRAFEQFVDDPRTFVADILRFAGKPAGDEVIDRLRFEVRKNTAEAAIRISAQRHIHRLAWRSELNQAPLLDSKLARAAARGAMRVAKTFPLPQGLIDRSELSLRRTVGEIVGDRYAASNRVTAELAGIDLARYGWPV
jgi:hypothetical protein